MDEREAFCGRGCVAGVRRLEWTYAECFYRSFECEVEVGPSGFPIGRGKLAPTPEGMGLKYDVWGTSGESDLEPVRLEVDHEANDVK